MGKKLGLRAITPEAIAFAAILVRQLYFHHHVFFTNVLRKARFLLSPDPEFSPVGAITRVDYVKAFKTYRNMILEEASTPTYQAIISSINASLFGKGKTSNRTNRAIGGDGESEDEMEEYRRRLKESSRPSPDPAVIDTHADSLPTVDVPGPDTDPVSIPVESETEEGRPVVPKRPAPTKKKAVSSTDLNDPAPENSAHDTTPEDLIHGNPDPPARGRKKASQKKKTVTTSDQPTQTLRGNRAK